MAETARKMFAEGGLESEFYRVYKLRGGKVSATVHVHSINQVSKA